jgi:hypothetical protein
MASSSQGNAVKKVDDVMDRRSVGLTLVSMNDHDKHIVDVATERFERRLAEENSKLRVEMATGFGQVRAEMATGFGGLRAEIGNVRAEGIERNHELLKWALVFWATQIAAIAALLALMR